MFLLLCSLRFLSLVSRFPSHGITEFLVLSLFLWKLFNCYKAASLSLFLRWVSCAWILHPAYHIAIPWQKVRLFFCCISTLLFHQSNFFSVWELHILQISKILRKCKLCQPAILLALPSIEILYQTNLNCVYVLYLWVWNCTTCILSLLQKTIFIYSQLTHHNSVVLKKLVSKSLEFVFLQTMYQPIVNNHNKQF